MKKKEKLSIVIIFSLSLSVILPNVLGQITYTCKVKVGDEFIYTVYEGGINVGNKSKIKITDVEEGTNYFYIEYDYWDPISKGESFNSIADGWWYEDFHKDPSNGYMYIYYFVLTPVNDYLTAYANAAPCCSSSGNKLTETVGQVQYISTFDSNGVLTKKELKVDDTAIIVLSRGGSTSGIPGYDLPLLIGLTAITSVSIINIVKKKKFQNN